MATIITETFELPHYWVVALVNDDMSAMDDREIARLERFIEHQMERYDMFFIVSISEPYFSDWHDARTFGELPGDVAECVVQTATITNTKGD